MVSFVRKRATGELIDTRSDGMSPITGIPGIFKADVVLICKFSCKEGKN